MAQYFGNGDPKEYLTRYNRDPSWDEEIAYFENCILTDRPVKNSSSKDAFNTMKLVYKIYYADQNWQSTYNIKNPEKYKI